MKKMVWAKGVSMTAIVLLLIVLPFLAACKAPPPKPPIKIGVLNPTSGVYAINGLTNNKGIAMYLEEIGYEVAGRKIKVIYEDTEMKPEVALSKAKRLVEMEKVNILIGVASSSVAYALRDYVTDRKVPLLICMAAGADGLTKHDATPYILRSTFSNYTSAAVCADYAYNHLGARRVSMAGLDYVAGVEFLAGFARVFKKLGGEILQETYTPVNTHDFSPYLAQIAPTTDLLFTFIGGSDGLRFMLQFEEYGFKGKLPHICFATTEEEVLQDQGDAALGTYRGATWSPGLDTPENNKFVESYYQKYGECPTQGSARGYVAGIIMSEAIKAVNGNAEDTEALIKAMRGLAVKGPTGEVRFDDYGMAIIEFYIGTTEKVEGKPWKYENRVVYTYEVDQFWPFTPAEYMAMPELATLRGTLAGKQ